MKYRLAFVFILFWFREVSIYACLYVSPSCVQYQTLRFPLSLLSGQSIHPPCSSDDSFLTKFVCYISSSRTPNLNRSLSSSVCSSEDSSILSFLALIPPPHRTPTSIHLVCLEIEEQLRSVLYAASTFGVATGGDRDGFLRLLCAANRLH